MREALDLWIDDAEGIELVDDVQLPQGIAATVKRSLATRRKLVEARAAAGAATAEAAHQLVDEVGLGVRDAAYLLGVSHQRVQQLLRGAP